MKTDEEWDKELEGYSIEELERLAVELHDAYHRASFDMKQGHRPSLDSIKGKSELWQVLQERKHRLNDGFRFTLERVACFVKISDLLTECLEKAWAEAKPIMQELDKRIQDQDPFVQDYELELKLHVFVTDPQSDDRGIYGVLQDIISAGSTVLQVPGRCYEEHNTLNELNWNAIDELRHYETELADHYIGHAMHELYSHSMWSLPDIFKITELWAEVIVTRQHFRKI
ncbi:hypothetical protein OpiT1DRAFT_02243 [Opitutaceae bacterium TAV1]|nr:hypothetical protein OpiT1DRAFT_02243 [Opitutaceae bacterium TAV1]